MASTSKCKYCGQTVSSSDEHCPHCGAPNEGYVADTERQIFLPKTIEELKEYCAERGMPLLRMRFFIGEDYRQPKAFGIYRDGDDVIVYKNKADGERAIRYRGPDEEHAVGELFAKLLEECHSRGIYPDGKPLENTAAETEKRGSIYSSSKQDTGTAGLTFVLGILIFLVIMMISLSGNSEHRTDGYYGIGDGDVYYHYGTQWYYTDESDDLGNWYKTSGFPTADYEEYALGRDWNSDWGARSFYESDTWKEIEKSRSSSSSSSSSDYDSWDSDDTDWDSDW